MSSQDGNTQRSLDERKLVSVERDIREHLDRLLCSAHFDASIRSREFLAYVVHEALAGRGAQLHQASIARAVFGRSGAFDAVLDPIVRVQAGRLRRSLERYYLLTGGSDPYRIELPKGSYAPVFTPREASGSEPQTAAHPHPRADWPALLVQPFSVDPASDAAVHLQLNDELTKELCRYGDVHVIRRGDADDLDPGSKEAIRFEFRGTLRHEGDDRLVGARLIDRRTGRQLWSDELHTGAATGRWSGNIIDIARVLAARIGNEYGVIAREHAVEYAAGALDPGSPSGAIARCYHFFYSRKVDDLGPLVETLRRLTARAPEFGLAWMYLARLYVVNHSFELTSLPTPMSDAIPYAYQGVLLDPASARARCILAVALIVDGETSAALEELEQALRLNADSLAYREIIGWLLALGGEWDRGVALMRETIERNPYCLPHVNHGLWANHVRCGEFEAAHRAALEYRDSTYFWRELMIASCLGHLGRPAEGQASVTRLLQAKPQFPARARTLIGHYIKSEELCDTIIEGLRRSGLELAE